MSTIPNQIQKTITLDAPVERVWEALTDYQEFGRWFMVELEGPFIPGSLSTGHITYPGYEEIPWEAMIVDMVTHSHFAFTWHPYAVDEEVDYHRETPTLVSFDLTPIDAGGCQLTITESGFDIIPEDRREEAYLMNEGGWSIQLENIRRYLAEDE